MALPVTLEMVMEAVEEDNYLGYCLACGVMVEDVEPDARGYVCEECGANKVYGAEELLIMMSA